MSLWCVILNLECLYSFATFYLCLFREKDTNFVDDVISNELQLNNYNNDDNLVQDQCIHGSINDDNQLKLIELHEQQKMPNENENNLPNSDNDDQIYNEEMFNL